MAKIELIIVVSGKAPWLDEAIVQYQKKLKPFCEFNLVPIKSKNFSRGQKSEKIKYERDKILNYLQPNDFVWILDEQGKNLSSIAFSKQLQKTIELGKRRIIFIIGGAFGLDEDVKIRAEASLCLSPMVLSHHIAQVVFLEQLYRGFTILKGIPYHNE